MFLFFCDKLTPPVAILDGLFEEGPWFILNAGNVPGIVKEGSANNDWVIIK